MAFANLGTRLGRERMVGGVPALGLRRGRAARCSARRAASTRAPRTPRQLADSSIGLELVDVTPLHAALLAAVVANDGRLPSRGS